MLERNIMSEVFVRQAEGSDWEAIAGFNKAMALETEGKELSETVVAEGTKGLLENRDYGFYVVAENGGEVVGSLMVTFEWSDWRNGVFWWVQSVYVKPEYRKGGIFKKLYEYIKQAASESSGVCGLRLYVEKDNDMAQAVYDKLGMQKTNYLLYEDSL
jgi:ribosomal protein S18 acetylase RimI-like enzyme